MSSARRKKVIVLVILVCAVSAALLLKRLVTRTNGDVIAAVVRHCVNVMESSGFREDCARVILIEDGFPIYRFAVTRGKPGHETVVARGRLNTNTLEIADRNGYLDGLEYAFYGYSSARVSRFVRPLEYSEEDLSVRRANLRRVLPPGEDIERAMRGDTETGSPFFGSGTPYLWYLGLERGWFARAEDVILLVIERETAPKGMETNSWGVRGDLAYGRAPRGEYGGEHIAADIDIKTLKMVDFRTD